ncbi:MAG: type I restriction endonuclease subunit R, partial [Planctomycetaceae bacterium]|nr:type I restriction endonuclease subunit R [Planctomycetaceae bacterium]
MSFTESNYENAIIELFRNTLGYTHVCGYDVKRDYSDPFYAEELLPSLQRVNPQLPETVLNEAVQKIRNIENGTLQQKNVRFMDYLQNGVTVDYYDGKEQRSDLVYLVDYQNVNNNSFVIANQWTFTEKSEKRPDMIVFLNGLPLVVFELKSPSRENTDVSAAYRQLRNYMREIPSLFIYNAFLVMSDLANSKVGTLTASEDRFIEWKTKDGSYENTQVAQFDTLLEGMFQKERFLDIIKNFICYEGTKGDKKILAAYHQYFAVKKAIASTQHAAKTDGKGGVFWHTQGSGKSLSMVFYAHLLRETLDFSTIVVLTDRNDLDNQLFEQFARCSNFLRQKPEQAENRIHLKNLLAGRQANGIIFTTMQKFEESSEPLSNRRNIVVLADEAHRGQYGLEEKVDAKTGRIILGMARMIRDNLPNATYIGFTGTPISQKDRSTIEVFGNYVDIYDMTQSVEDGTTKPVYYESRVIHLKLNKEILKRIDEEYDVLAQNAEPYAIEKSKKELGQMETILGADQTIETLCNDIISHYENFRQHELTGKAMIVAYSRPIAMKIYRKMLELRPHWDKKLGVVMTSGNNDPEYWNNIIGNKNHRDEMARKFKEDNDPFKIVIVVDMWLTGFDVPSLATMYIYKPMKEHTLMQAIARVNRVYQDKAGGLAVDYVGIASALKQAMNDYTKRDRDQYGDTDIAKTALPKFIEKLEVCRGLLHGYDYSEFLDKHSDDLQRAKTISGGVNFLAAVDKEKERTSFIKETLLLRQALSLCRSLLDAEQRFEAAYFEAVRTMLTRMTGKDKSLSIKEINDQINELLKASIQSKGVINLFSDAETEFSLFDPKFLAEISRMKERNLAVEILRKLLAEQVSLYKRTNLVKSEKFSERLTELMNSYIKGLITNEEVIDELTNMAKAIATAHEEGKAMNLTDEELAFYDALTKPEAVKDFYENGELIAMTHELAEMLRKNRTIDWQQKESARAGMRRMVKKLLKKYKYPPEGLEITIDTVIRQCEMWTD